MSGEGCINEVRDPIQKYNTKEKTFEITDPGITDKRLMIVEQEFASALSVAERQGNTCRRISDVHGTAPHWSH